MEQQQQFHLKWNNHSMNTLSAFQNLLDSNTLVDVSLTCSNGKTVRAHRMVLAACSEYFYQLFKDMPEKHPVIVFKDATEEIVRDLLLFMYQGEVEVQEIYLSDFLQFASTLQVKGLTQSEKSLHLQREQTVVQHNNNNITTKRKTSCSISEESDKKTSRLSKRTKSPFNPSAFNKIARLTETPDTPLSEASPSTPVDMSSTLSDTQIKQESLNGGPYTNMDAFVSSHTASMAAKSYLAGKFSPLFPLTSGPPVPTLSTTAALSDTANFFTHVTSPNLYRALQRKYQAATGNTAFPQTRFPSVGHPFDLNTATSGLDPSILKGMPFLKDMLTAAAAAVVATSNQPTHLLPTPPPPSGPQAMYLPNADNNYSTVVQQGSGIIFPNPNIAAAAAVNSFRDDEVDCADYISVTDSGTGENGIYIDVDTPIESEEGSPLPPPTTPTTTSDQITSKEVISVPTRTIGGSKPAGRGSRLERMIAAEYKILSEYSDAGNNESLPVMTPELMKSRRTHSLQLAIGEILHNRASVQSAATKYRIPRETLRRHYQRYIKAVGSTKKISVGTEEDMTGLNVSNSTDCLTKHTAVSLASAGAAAMTTISPSVATGTMAAIAAAFASAASGQKVVPNNFSSLMDIGQAYGIWNTDADCPLDFRRKPESRITPSPSSVNAIEPQTEDKDDLVIDDNNEDEHIAKQEDDNNDNIDNCDKVLPKGISIPLKSVSVSMS